MKKTVKKKVDKSMNWTDIWFVSEAMGSGFKQKQAMFLLKRFGKGKKS